MDFESLTREAEKKGWVELSSGVYLESQENFIAEQKTWEDEDPGKSFDFTGAPFWLITDTGEGPFPIRYEEDLEDIFGGKL